MPTLTLGPTYFRNELNDAYASFGQAFARENVQNSVDAGASLISINFTPMDKIIRVEFTDNGCGMSKDTLDNVFFRLGETTKTRAGSQSGGFGRARIMTHFAQERYEIITRDNNVVGVGEEYHYTPSQSFFDGCKMIIDVNPLDRYGRSIDIKQAFIDYLSLCQLPCKVEIDGQRHTEWTYRRQVLKPLSHNGVPFANLHLNREAGKDGEKILVRVNGTLMFHQDVAPKVQLILEIDPQKSREVLQSSRDSLHWDYRAVLNNFINELATETKSALDRNETTIQKISGCGTFQSYREDANPTLTFGTGQKVAQNFSDTPPQFAIVPSSSTSTSLSNPSINLTQEDRNNLFDILMISDMGEFSPEEKKSVRAVLSSYNPKNWKKTDKGTFKGLTKAKLILIWKLICHHVIKEALIQFNKTQLSWGVGWTFGNGAASYLANNGIHFLLLNPVNRDGKLRYGIRDQNDLNYLFAAAVHEVCHVIHDRHDEDFAKSQTELMAKALKQLPQIKKTLKNIYKIKMI